MKPRHRKTSTESLSEKGAEFVVTLASGWRFTWLTVIPLVCFGCQAPLLGTRAAAGLRQPTLNLAGTGGGPAAIDLIPPPPPKLANEAFIAPRPSIPEPTSGFKEFDLDLIESTFEPPAASSYLRTELAGRPKSLTERLWSDQLNFYSGESLALLGGGLIVGGG